MLSFNEYNNLSEESDSITLDEGNWDSALEFISTFIPDAVLQSILKTAHKKQYALGLKAYIDMTNDKTRKLSKGEALNKAAGMVNLKARELQKVIDRSPKLS